MSRGSYHKSSSSRHSKHFDEKKKKAPEPTVSDPGLLNRTAWTNAAVALVHIKKGRATGNKPALWMRSRLQEELYQLGRMIQEHAGKVLFTGLLLLASLTIGLKSVVIEDRIEKLWVEEGGRLDRELAYVEETLGSGSGGINQMVIQTGEDAALLTPDSLLHHLDVLKSATRVTVEMDDVTWKLSDLCYKTSMPETEIQFVETILDRLFPCAIITPLDCFWEGSQILGPDFPVHIPLGGDEGSLEVSWPTLNPIKLFERMRDIYTSFPFDVFRDFMKRAGINSGYQEKPCLDPHDPRCPETAPNKVSRRTPEVGAELTGGCYGFATRYMHWPEQLIVGGGVKNKTGYIKDAGGLQSMVQLMGPKDMHDYWSNTYKVHTINWSQEKAEEILGKFQKNFEEAIKSSSKNGKKYDFHSYSSLGLENIMNTFSELSLPNIAMGYAFMMVYTVITLYRWTDKVRSQSGLGLAGVLLVAITVGAGMGLAALIGISFNAASTQIVPFLALGLGVDSMFLLIHTFSQQTHLDISYQDQVGEVLRKAGVSVLTTAICNVAAFLSAALIPIPALRAFCFQAALLTGLNLFSMLLLFPAMIALDVRRVFAGKLDVLFCLKQEGTNATSMKEVTNNDMNELKVQKLKQTPCSENYPKSLAKKCPTDSFENQRSTRDLIDAEAGNERCYISCTSDCNQWTLTSFVTNYYSQWIIKTPVKVLTIVIAVALLVASVYGIGKVEDGLDLTDVVPRNTSVWRFLQAQDKYFGFYNMYAVTQGNYEYPQNQRLMYEYHDSFVRVNNIIKDDDGGLPEFWLSLFRTWLTKLQDAYDNDKANGFLDEEGWTEKATDDAVLAYKLLVQTGHVDYPVDKSLLRNTRLVDDGIINPNAFYNYLSAWYSNDAMAYSYSQATLVPTPKEWFHDPKDYDLKIPKSKPIKYAQIPFLLNNLGDTKAMVTTIKQVREICERFQTRGLPNFPNGIPFTFWEQYIGLRFYLLLALAAALTAVFVVVSILLMSPWAAALILVILSSIIGQLFGALGILGIKLSAVPAVILILAVGLGVEFTIHILMSFVGSLGDRNRRTLLALEHMFAPVVHGAFSTFLGVLMLAFSQFDFIVRYFFLVLLALILLGLFNGLVFLPVLLVIVGPPAHVVPSDNPDYLPPCTPEPSPVRFKVKPPRVKSSSRSDRSDHGFSSHKPKRHNSDISLSTIAEETHSHASSESVSSYEERDQDPGSVQSSFNGTSVFLEPHITVETSTVPANGSSSGSSRCSSPSMGGQVTKVTATAKFKLELHTPAPESSRPSSRRSRRSSASSRNGDCSTHSSLADPLRSSGEHSLASSLSSDGGFSEK